ncbi:MAG: protein kinase [Fimbriiglobus sp.]|nr:protein kinase [Fimbriiglobus sp.]
MNHAEQTASANAAADSGPATATCDLIPYQLPSTPMPPVLRVEGYDILERLGSGGMGVVFKARHRQLNRIVALKMLNWNAYADQESHRRFQAEAEAVARLQHANIIQVFDVGAFRERTDDSRPRPFLSLEYVDGGSLYKHTLTPQDPRLAAGWIATAARAVQAAHQVGVVHRDLKPANVLLTTDGQPKIADFGLAKRLDDGGCLTLDGACVGTPEYMAPEQVDGLPATPAFDIYSLGVMLYELLTGSQPFKGLTITETMMLVKYQEAVPPSRLRPSLPRDLETITLKCMAKNPAARYATAGELADDLDRWLTGRPISARPVSGLERLGRWGKRNPALAALSVVALGLAIGGVGGVMWKWRDAVANAELAEERAKEAKDREAAAEWELYRGCLASATADLRLNTLTTTRETLLQAPVRFRGWEWHHAYDQLDLSREVHRVEGVEAFEPAAVPGDRICLSLHGGVWVWDKVGRKHLWTVRHPGYWATQPDGRGWLQRVDARNLAFRSFSEPSKVVRVGLDADVNGFSFSADGRQLLVVTHEWSQVYDTETGRTVGVRHTNLTPEGGGPGMNALSSDGRLAALNYTISGDTEVWEVESGRVRCTLRKQENLLALRFTPGDSRLLVNEAYPVNRVSLWDVTTGSLAAELKGHTNNVRDQVYSPDRTRLATASKDRTVKVWDAASGQILHTLSGHTSTINAVVFSPNGERLVSASDDRTLRIWDVATGQEVAVLRGHTREVTGATFVGPNTVASVALDGTVRYWETGAGPGSGVWNGHSGFVYAAAYHPDGKHVVSGSWDGTARVWDETGREVRTFQMPLRMVAERRGEKILEPERVTGLAIHPAGQWVATVSWGDNVHLWDFTTGKKLHSWERDQKSWMTGRVAFHPTADLLACGGGRAEVSVYDPRTKKTVAVLETKADTVPDVAFSPDGRWLVGVGGVDKTVHVWEVATWREVASLTAAADAHYSVAFSPDGRTLACGAVDGNVYLWDTTTWERQKMLPHGVKVYALAYTPDGTRLACGCADNTVRLWDTTRHTQVAELRGHSDYVHSLAFDPNGHRLVTASGDHTLRVWDAPRR